jgi:hypothetical protein
LQQLSPTAMGLNIDWDCFVSFFLALGMTLCHLAVVFNTDKNPLKPWNPAKESNHWGMHNKSLRSNSRNAALIEVDKCSRVVKLPSDMRKIVTAWI